MLVFYEFRLNFDICVHGETKSIDFYVFVCKIIDDVCKDK